MAASFTIAARNNGVHQGETRDATLASVRAYREAMAEFAQMGTLDIWYARLSEEQLMEAIELTVATQKGKAPRRQPKACEKTAEKNVAKAHTRDSLQALSKLAELVDGRVPDRQPAADRHPRRGSWARSSACLRRVEQRVREQLRAYRATLPGRPAHLLERFEVIDVARKVVGVGSVGTRAFIALLQGRDEQDPLFLQVKEATASVLEDHLPKSRFKQPGERVVQGQRMMQAASDIFLGWTKGVRTTATSTGANCAT